jgi:hypothetical protein
MHSCMNVALRAALLKGDWAEMAKSFRHNSSASVRILCYTYIDTSHVGVWYCCIPT